MSLRDFTNDLSLEDGLKSYTLQEHVLEYCNKLGFTPASPPQITDSAGQPVWYRGNIPTDLTTLNDEELGQYMTLLSLWMDYVGDQLTLLETARDEAKEKKIFVEAKVRLTYKADAEGRKYTNPERDDLVTVDARFVEANSRYLYFNACATLVKGVYQSASQNYKAVSRRITQRGQEVERGTRNNNVGGTRGPVTPGQPLMPGRIR